MEEGSAPGLRFPGDGAPDLPEGLAPWVRALAIAASWLGELAHGEALAVALDAAAAALQEVGLPPMHPEAAAFWAAALALGLRDTPPGLRGLDPGLWGYLNRGQRHAASTALLALRESRGGGALVAALDRLPRMPVPWEVQGLADLAAGGLEPGELAWVVDRALSEGRDFRDQAEPARAARVLRRVDDLLRELLPAEDESRGRTVSALYDALEQPGVAAAVEAFLDWVDTLALAQLDGPGRRDLVATLRTLAVAGGRGPRLVSLLRRWARPPRRLPRHPAEELVGEEETLRELRRLALYQRWAGEEPRLPARVARRLDGSTRRARERAALEAREVAGELSEGARARLEHLRGLPEDGVDEAWVRRRLREARTRVALAGLRAGIRDAVERGWRELFGAPPPELGEGRLLELLSWADGLRGPDRRRLEELVTAWRAHGAGYRRELPENQAWLAAPPGGLDAAAWLQPPRRRTKLSDGRGVTVEVADDPFRVLLMGSFFDTCLALGSGFNRRAVLANAREVNKAVVFWTRADGAVLGRKLVGVNPQGEVVGFHSYLALPAEDADRPRLDALGTELVEAWAESAGTRLGSQGTPPVLGRAFWYDDGAVAWARPGDPSDREALWRAELPALAALARDAGLPAPPKDASPALRQDWLLELARSRGALPPPPWPGPGEVALDHPDRALVVATHIAGGEPPRAPGPYEGGRLELLPVLGEGPRSQAWRRASMESGDLLWVLAHGDVPGDPRRTAARLRPVAQGLAKLDWLPSGPVQWRWLARLAFEDDGRTVPADFVAALLRRADQDPFHSAGMLLALASLPEAQRRGAGLRRLPRARLERRAGTGDREAGRRLAAAALLAPGRGLDAALARVAEGHPEALLALALRRGPAARATVARGLARWPERVAALIAWRIVTGDDAVLERHRQAPDGAPTRGRACAAAQVLYRELSAGATRVEEAALLGLDDWERRETLPLLVDAWCQGRWAWPEVEGDAWCPAPEASRLLLASLAGRAPDEEVRAWASRGPDLPLGELLLVARRAGWRELPEELSAVPLAHADLALVSALVAQGLTRGWRVTSLPYGWELPPEELAATLRQVRDLPGTDWSLDRTASPLGRAVLEAVLAEAREAG
jgi:hypothetical protein